MKKHRLVTTAIRWSARLAAAGMFVLAGIFFVEHLLEWFIKPLPLTPPGFVWIGQLLHLAYLLALAAGWKWPRLGGITSIAIAVIFLIDKNPPLILPAVMPGILYLISWYLDRPQKMPLTT